MDRGDPQPCMVDRLRSAAPGQPARRCPTRSPITLMMARVSKCLTPLRRPWRRLGAWTTTPRTASSRGIGAGGGTTSTPRRFSTSGRTGRRRIARWAWPSCRSGQTNASRTAASWRTEAPSPGCTSPSIGCGFPQWQLRQGGAAPFLPYWPEDWVPRPRRYLLVGGGQPAGPNGDPDDQDAPAQGPEQEGSLEQLLYGPRMGPMVEWDAVAGMVWNRPDPGSTSGGPLWSAAPGAPGTKWGPLKPSPRCDSAFVLKLPDYRSKSVQRFLDIDWVKLAHSVTKEIYPEEGGQGALHTVRSPAPPISYGQARDYVLYRFIGMDDCGVVRLSAGRLHLHRDLCPGRDMQARCPLQGHRHPPMVRTSWAATWSPSQEPSHTPASRPTMNRGGTLHETSTRRSSACIGWRTITSPSRISSSPSWTWTRLSMRKH